MSRALEYYHHDPVPPRHVALLYLSLTTSLRNSIRLARAYIADTQPFTTKHRQHYRKIRQESDRTFSNGTAPSSSSSTPSSAATKGKGKPGRPKGSNGPGKRKQANTLMATNGDEDLDDDNDDDDLHARGTGAHGVKRDESPLVGKGRASKKVKVEEGDDGVVDALGLGGLLDEEDLLV